MLPLEMGQLSYLVHLNLKGLNDLSDPPHYVQRDCHECIRYLKGKLQQKTTVITEEEKVDKSENGRSPTEKSIENQ